MANKTQRQGQPPGEAVALVPELVTSAPAALVAAMERPLVLIEIGLGQFTQLSEQFADIAGPLLEEVKRRAGLFAWAARHHYSDGEYGPKMRLFGKRVGVSEDTLFRYRDTVVSELGLPLPAVTRLRSTARRGAADRVATAARHIRQTAPSTAPEVERARQALGGPAKVVELGAAGPASIQQAVGLLLEISPVDLAASASTEELRALEQLLKQAQAHQRREALRARSRQANQATGTGR